VSATSSPFVRRKTWSARSSAVMRNASAMVDASTARRAAVLDSMDSSFSG
jgi:hypothetical protein